MTHELTPIDWSGGTYDVVDGVTVETSQHSSCNRASLIQRATRQFERHTPYDYYVYAFKFTRDGDVCWYVGQTENLYQRSCTHLNDKTISNIEHVEGVNSRAEARERERELSYEMAIEKNTTSIYGGR